MSLTVVLLAIFPQQFLRFDGRRVAVVISSGIGLSVRFNVLSAGTLGEMVALSTNRHDA
jgi:hypothetical protein